MLTTAWSRRPPYKIYDLINSLFNNRFTHYFNSLFISERVTSEEWIICEPGAYLPDVYEEVYYLT